MSTDTKFHGFAIKEKGGKWEPFEWDAGAIGPEEVEIKVESCGICHSDFSMAKNDWGMTKYPFVGGHEIYGKIASVGKNVNYLKEGQRVGLGWSSAFCGHCRYCRVGDDSLCDNGQGTIVGRHGGFADRVRAAANAVVPVPDGYEGDHVGPLFCGGITIFSPILEYAKPEMQVGVIGIGGIGSMAVQFLNAWGCHVTAFTSSASKKKSALDIGARDAISSTDVEELKANAGRFDLIICTVNVTLDWDAVIGTLAKRGRIHLIGAVMEPLRVTLFPLLMGHKTISASPTGSVQESILMLNFANRHNIKPPVQVFKFAQINEAFEELEKSKQGRIVLKW
jgi:uncharacterized zinc-type alcohol dehydrogenase-like protein